MDGLNVSLDGAVDLVKQALLASATLTALFVGWKFWRQG